MVREPAETDWRTGWRTGFEHAATVLPGRDVRVLFGAGSLDLVAEEARALGGRALLVAGPHEDHAASVVLQALAGDAAGRLRDVAQHVPVALALAAVQRASADRVGVLVALGGGSATGLAKAVARELHLPVLAVPTTYAGSEMTPVWGLTDASGKTTGRDVTVLPRTVVYDPLLTASLPAALTAASGMNALAHAVESLYAPDRDEATVEVAGRAVTALVRALPVAVHRPADPAGRAEALYGAWLAGWALGSTVTGPHHKLAHVLGGKYGLPHAAVHSALLPHVVGALSAEAGDALAPLAGALGEPPTGLGPALHRFARGLGAPTALAGLGRALGDDDLRSVARVVAGSGVPSPRPLSEEGLLALLRDARAGGQP